MGGFWEFPGGKVEPGEDVRDALARELKEELAISVSAFQPLIQIRHDYPDKSVLLDTWTVSDIEGEPRGNEGQEVKWVEPESLTHLSFPPANVPIVRAVQLPHCYMITGRFDHPDDLFRKVDASLASGVKLIQFRAPWLDPLAYIELAEVLSERVRSAGAVLLIKGALSLLERPWCHGLHLTSAQLLSSEIKPAIETKVREGQWLAASCHGEAELARAEALALDFVTLSPVARTTTHPEAEPLGIKKARSLTERSVVPVYWLGGQDLGGIEQARLNGAQGVAAINAFWR